MLYFLIHIIPRSPRQETKQIKTKPFILRETGLKFRGNLKRLFEYETRIKQSSGRSFLSPLPSFRYTISGLNVVPPNASELQQYGRGESYG